MRLKPGDTIGEYTILEVIGNGGFSVIYQAEDSNLLRTVAIKQFLPDAFSEEGTREWFVREARLSASLNHPNIVAIYALREQGEYLFLIMEYLAGGDLHTLINKKGPLPLAAVVKVATDMCSALQTLHARNVLHRDIKPENILIGDEGQFKLADFGLAHIHQAQLDGPDDARGPQPGTLLYMSPEQALGEEVTVRSDVYSLAVVLYEAMTGHYYLDYDHSSEDDDLLRAMIAEAEPFPLNRHDPTVPHALGDVLLRALAKAPADRPASAREFLGEIKNAVARSKRASLPARRPSKPMQRTSPRNLVRELYAIRTLRDIENQPVTAQEQLAVLWQRYASVPEVMAEWGETLLDLGQVAEGREWLEQAVAERPALPFAQLALADLYRSVDEDNDAADGALIEAIVADPDLVYAVLYEDIAAAADDPAAALAYADLFERAAEEVPSAPLHHNLGQVRSLAGDLPGAVDAFQAALGLDPNYGPAYVGLGSLLIDLDDLPEAIALLTQGTYRVFPALAADEMHKTQTVYQRQHAYLALAVAYTQAGQYENSAIAARTVLELAPDDLEEDAESLLEAYENAAHAWIAASDYLRAYKLLNQIIPLAAYWGRAASFMLLEQAERLVPPADRRQRQWDDALDWLKDSMVTINQSGDAPASRGASGQTVG